MKPCIADDDLIYAYKEQWLTGFAPCFDKDVYSLACCKGKKNGGGLRDLACKNFAKGKNIWVLSIAGADIKANENNKTGIDYNPGDMISIAKVTDVKSWKEYSTEFSVSERRDSIYFYENGKMVWRANRYSDHPDGKYIETDCETMVANYTEYKQILVSEEFYIFDAGYKACYDIKRGFSVWKNNPNVLRNYLRNHPKCIRLESKSPFA